MKKIIILSTIAVIIGATIVVLNLKKTPQNTVNVNKVNVVNVDNIPNVNNFEECLAANYPILESYPRQCKTPNNKTFVEIIGNMLEKTDLITLSNPLPNQVITSPLVIEGLARGAWYFEASFPVKLYDEDNNLIAETTAHAQSNSLTDDFIPFKAEFSFNYLADTRGTLVLENDNPSGLPENADSLTLPIKFGAKSQEEKIKIKIYLNNDRLDPEVSCTKVFPVEREIIKTTAVARAALTELLAGVTTSETESGFSTSLNSNIQIQSLSIANGIAKVDFDEQLGAAVGGSCRVSAIRAQITETLKQFSGVKSVVISINSQTEDILQP